MQAIFGSKNVQCVECNDKKNDTVMELMALPFVDQNGNDAIALGPVMTCPVCGHLAESFLIELVKYDDIEVLYV
jgi:hypothetical protein